MRSSRREHGSVCSSWGRALFALWSFSIVGSYGSTEAGVWRTDCADIGVVGPSGNPHKSFLGDVRGSGVDENTLLCDPRQFAMLGRLLERQPSSRAPLSHQGMRGSAGCYVRPGAEKLPFMQDFCDGSSLDKVAGYGEGELDYHPFRPDF